MRLTLRTMLAALDADDRLDPADVDELLAKIEQSTFASNLAAQIRRVVQHPRLGAPRLDGKGMGLDPNSVAEYLDSTLASDKIAEFERICIASEVQLAEVASCHQVLVLVLEQAAEFEPALRDRIYQLGAQSKRTLAEAQASFTHTTADGTQHRIDTPAQATTVPSAATTAATSTAAAASADAKSQPKPKPEVPDYLRTPRRLAMWPMALAALLAFVAVVGVLRLFGPLDQSHPMAKMLRGGSAGTEVAVNDDPNVDVPVAPVAPEVPQPTDNGDKKETEPANKVTDVAPQTGVTDPQPTADQPLEPPIIDDNMPLDPPEPTAVTPPVAPVEPPKVADTSPQVKNPPPQDLPRPPAADVGLLLSENQVLVRLGDDGSYQRVPARAPLFAGDELTVFIGSRPQISLATNVQLTIAGESHVLMGATDSEGLSHLTIDFGRVLAASVGRADAKLALRAGHVQGTATFSNVDSELAIEVRNYLPPGANPLTAATIPITRLYATRGKVTWKEGPAAQDGPVFAIQSGEVRSYLGDEAGITTTLAAPPDWVDGKHLSDIDRLAARDIETKLSGERPLELSLTEMASEAERRAELRALSVRALATLEQFEPIIAVLNDDTQRAYWTAEFDALRSAIARSPQSAARVRAAFQKLRGEKSGDLLFRMLWGYSLEDLDPELQKQGTGAAVQLVDWLDSEELAYRVLAFENLRRITGSTQLYLPHLAAARRRTPIAQWRERLKAGEIAYKTPPAPIQDPKPTGAAPAPSRASADPLLE